MKKGCAGIKKNDIARNAVKMVIKIFYPKKKNYGERMPATMRPGIVVTVIQRRTLKKLIFSEGLYLKK